MTKEKPPTLKKDSPLHRGSLWIWVPVMTGTGIGVFVNWLLSRGACGR